MTVEENPAYPLQGNFWFTLPFEKPDGDNYVAQVFILSSKKGDRPPGIPNNMNTPYEDDSVDFYIRGPLGEFLPPEVERTVDWQEIETACFEFLKTEREN